MGEGCVLVLNQSTDWALMGFSAIFIVRIDRLIKSIPVIILSVRIQLVKEDIKLRLDCACFFIHVSIKESTVPINQGHLRRLGS